MASIMYEFYEGTNEPHLLDHTDMDVNFIGAHST